MKFDSVVCRRVDDCSHQELSAAGPGAFHWGEQEAADGVTVRLLWIVMPYSSEARSRGDSIHALVVLQNGEDHVALRTRIGDRAWWRWDGNEDQPTLSPSIACGPRDNRHWHGYLTAGRLEACE